MKSIVTSMYVDCLTSKELLSPLMHPLIRFLITLEISDAERKSYILTVYFAYDRWEVVGFYSCGYFGEFLWEKEFNIKWTSCLYFWDSDSCAKNQSRNSVLWLVSHYGRYSDFDGSLFHFPDIKRELIISIEGNGFRSGSFWGWSTFKCPLVLSV